MSALFVAAERKSSPYVGPRAIREDEPFFGRELEEQALRAELLSAGVVLLHAPSGAGKTSLIQASLVPWCSSVEHLQVCATTEPRFSALRVNLPPPEGLDVRNRYVFSVVNALVGDHVDRRDAATMSIGEALSQFGGDADARQLVVLDQLEEALTLDPNDRLGQEEFFRQLGNALRSGRRWALLAVRDDHLGGLDRYRRFFPNELRNTFRLDFIDAAAAVRAVQGPAKKAHVEFTDAAAQRLVADLRRVRAAPAAIATGTPAEPVIEEASLYPYVEPVLLQVVCNNLWRILRKEPDFRTIEESDLDVVRPYHQALAGYYQAAVKKAAKGDLGVERGLRDWIERKMVTQQLTRRPTGSLPDVANNRVVVERLVSRYLVREDHRPGGQFWELTHDLLVDPVVADNRAWRQANLEPWRLAAEQWRRSGRDHRSLLTAAELGPVPAAPTIPLDPVERAFLDESLRRDAEETGRRRTEAAMLAFRYRVGYLRLALACSVVLNLLLLGFVIVLVVV